jgi:hypothetical protein
MSNLGRIYEFLSKRVACDVWFATITEHVRFPCELAGTTHEELRPSFGESRIRMSVIPLAPVHAE